MLNKLLTFASAVEIATGFALLVLPRLVIALLIGGEVSTPAVALGRVAGILMLALGVACWPRGAASQPPAVSAMLIYNALIALYLAYLFIAEHLGGMLLWPAVALHAAVAILLVWAWRERSTRTGGA